MQSGMHNYGLIKTLVGVSCIQCDKRIGYKRICFKYPLHIYTDSCSLPFD